MVLLGGGSASERSRRRWQRGRRMFWQVFLDNDRARLGKRTHHICFCQDCAGRCRCLAHLQRRMDMFTGGCGHVRAVDGADRAGGRTARASRAAGAGCRQPPQPRLLLRLSPDHAPLRRRHPPRRHLHDERRRPGAVRPLPPGGEAPAPGAGRRRVGAGRRARVRLPSRGDQRGVCRQDRLHQLPLHPRGRHPLRAAARLSRAPPTPATSPPPPPSARSATARIWRRARRTPAASAPASSATPGSRARSGRPRLPAEFQGPLRSLPPRGEGRPLRQDSPPSASAASACSATTATGSPPRRPGCSPRATARPRPTASSSARTTAAASASPATRTPTTTRCGTRT